MEVAVADLERRSRREIVGHACHCLPGELILGAAGDAGDLGAADRYGRAIHLVLRNAGARADERNERPDEWDIEVDVAVEHSGPVSEPRATGATVMEIVAVIEG